MTADQQVGGAGVGFIAGELDVGRSDVCALGNVQTDEAQTHGLVGAVVN
jgi:hypothetical protein